MARILVVDDNDDVRFLVRKVLEDEGHAVAEADCGPAALERLDPLPDLLLLDIQMPDMDGWDTLTQIREREETRALPVIMATVKASPDSRERGYALGCDGYVGKPFDLAELLEQVTRVLAERR